MRRSNDSHFRSQYDTPVLECEDFESEGCEGANDDMLPPLEAEEGSCLVDEDVRLPTETPTEFPTVDPTVDPVRMMTRSDLLVV